MPAVVWVLIAVGGGILAMVLVILVIMFAVGGRSVNEANYQRIQRGMSEAQVVAIMGRPHETRSQAMGGFNQVRALAWRSGRNEIAVGLLNDRVVFKVAKIGTKTMQESGM